MYVWVGQRKVTAVDYYYNKSSDRILFFLSQGLIKMAVLSTHGVNMTRVEMCLLEGDYLCVLPAS